MLLHSINLWFLFAMSRGKDYNNLRNFFEHLACEHSLRFGARRLWLPANGLRLTDSFFKTRRSCFKNLRHYSRVFLILNLERTMAIAFLFFQPATKLGQLSHASGLSLWRPVVAFKPLLSCLFAVPKFGGRQQFVTLFVVFWNFVLSLANWENCGETIVNFCGHFVGSPP